MIPDSIKSLTSLPGPFATVYLDATRSTEHGAGEVTSRWHTLRERLAGAGADAATLDALDAVVGTRTGLGGARGQVLVAAGGTVHLDRSPAAPPTQSWACWSPLPRLLPYLATRDPAVAHVLVVADRAGADITASAAEQTADAARAEPTRSVDGPRTYPLHETGRDTWDERHFQNRVHHNWAGNARDVATEVARAVAAVHAELVVLAGDPRARSLLRADFESVLGPEVTVIDIGSGSRNEGASGQALGRDVADALRRYTWRTRREVLAHLRANLGRHEFAVSGPGDVLDALRRAQADTVVLSDDPSSTLSAWIGPQPLQLAMSEQELHDMGVAAPQRERYDSAALRAIAGGDAQLVITPNGHDYVDGGIAALLRYGDAATPR